MVNSYEHVCTISNFHMINVSSNRYHLKMCVCACVQAVLKSPFVTPNFAFLTLFKDNKKDKFHLKIEKTIYLNLCLFLIYILLICIFESIVYYFAFNKCVLYQIVFYHFASYNFSNDNFVNLI